MARGRRIAFDYGDARIGVAICDPDGILATPLPFLDARSPKVIKQIAALLDEYSPISIFIGLPKHLSGAESSRFRFIAISDKCYPNYFCR